jgi:hypothetical protein
MGTYRPYVLVIGVLGSAAGFVGACGDDSSSGGPTDGGTDGTALDMGTDVTPSDVAQGDGGAGDADASGEGGGGDGGDGGETANLLIADQFNNRVIEITRQGQIVWTFGDGKNAPGATSVVAPNDALRLPNGDTLICGSGVTAGSGSCPADGGGCPDNRVIVVTKAGAIAWQYGQDGMSGTGFNLLNGPVGAVYIPAVAVDGGAPDGGDAGDAGDAGNVAGGDHVLITDQSNNRLIEVDRQSKQIVWQYPPANATANQMLNNPNAAERLATGNTLIADENNNRVIEVKTDGTIVWQYPTTPNAALLNGAAFASRLPNGHTLVTDTNNARAFELDTAMPPNVVWTYSTATRNPNQPAPQPSHAVRLANGNTLVADQLNDQVLEIDSTAQQNIVFSYGQLGMAGNAAGQLNAPYDVKAIGDYTGLTPPM